MIKTLQLAALEDAFKQPIDYWITCLSFESRCLTPIGSIPQNKIKEVIAFRANEFREHSESHSIEFQRKYSDSLLEVGFLHSDPKTFADSLTQSLPPRALSNKKVVIDISTFPRESLLILLRYIDIYKDLGSTNQIQLLYRTAKVSDSLSSGLLEVRTVLGYMGNASTRKQTHLIVLTGFEIERAKQIISELEPQFITIGHGGEDSSITPELYNRNCQFVEELTSYLPAQTVETFEHSLRDPDITKREILEVVGRRPNCNTIVAPLNTKISTVGAGLAAIDNREIQLCYAQMAEYSLTYSEPLDEVLLYNLIEPQTPASF